MQKGTPPRPIAIVDQYLNAICKIALVMFVTLMLTVLLPVHCLLDPLNDASHFLGCLRIIKVVCILDDSEASMKLLLMLRAFQVMHSCCRWRC